jgi:ATP-dependent Lhr-like helicase
MDLQQRVETAHAGTGRREFTEALWDLVWAGQISNDTFQPLRSLGSSSHRGRGPGRRGHALAGGRWFLVSELADASVTDTERLVARAECLLERYGLVSREAAKSESLPGGFGGLYQVLKAMEESGKIRRGYFVEGLSGAQFGHLGAIDRLRACRPDDTRPVDAEPEVMVLAALDPANVYGGLLPWPESGGGEATRPRRVVGAWVVLIDGVPLVYVAPNGRQLLTFTEYAQARPEALDLALRTVSRLPRAGRRLPVVEKVNGEPVLESPLLDTLLAAGFRRDYRGLVAVESHLGTPRA